MKVLRQPATTRISHWLITGLFFLLLVTGTMLRFHIRTHLFNALSLHLAVAVGMLVAGICYFVQALANGTIARLVLRARDLPKLLPMAQYYLGRRSAPKYDGYNPLQRATYTGLLFGLAPLLALTGLAIWPHAAFAHGLAALFGGKKAFLWHFILAIGLLVFVFGHTVMVAATGFANNMRSMITGWYELNPQGARASVRGEVLVARNSLPGPQRVVRGSRSPH